MTSYMAVNFMIQNALYGRVRWPLISEIYETAQAPYLAAAIFKTVANPRGAKFNVTAKDEVLEEDFISPIFKPLLAIFALTLLGVVAAAVRWVMFPGDHNIIMVWAAGRSTTSCWSARPCGPSPSASSAARCRGCR